MPGNSRSRVCFQTLAAIYSPLNLRAFPSLKNTLIITGLPSFCHTDLDECTDGSHSCHENAVCINTEGSFTCSCRHGYVGNGYNCTGESTATLRCDEIAILQLRFHCQQFRNRVIELSISSLKLVMIHHLIQVSFIKVDNFLIKIFLPVLDCTLRVKPSSTQPRFFLFSKSLHT